MRTGAPTRWVLAIVGVLCAGLIGATVATAVTSPLGPAAVGAPISATTARVSAEPFDDARDVKLTLQLGPERALRSPAGGRVTSMTCAVGVGVPSASSPVSIDGVPKLGLAMDSPLWRDLPRGSRGTDVDTLHGELKNLGYDVSRDGPLVGIATLSSIRTALAKIGSPARVTSTIPMSEIVWIPDRNAPTTGCDVSVGQQVAPGETLNTFAPTLVGAHITAMPAGLVPGARILEVGKIPIAVDDKGVVSDNAALGALAATPEYARAVADPTSPGVSATLRLGEAVDMAVVPPSAVVGPAGAQCVVSGSNTVAVTVVGSQLGQSYVTFPGERPAEVRLNPPQDTQCG